MPRNLSPKERSTKVLDLAVKAFSPAEFTVLARCVIKDALERDNRGNFGRQSSDLAYMITGGSGSEPVDEDTLARIEAQFGPQGVQAMKPAEPVRYSHLPITIGDAFYQFLCQEYSEDRIGSDPHDGITEPEKRQQKQDSYRAQCGKGKTTPDAELQYYTEIEGFPTAKMEELQAVSQQLIEYAFNIFPTENCCRVVIHGQQHTLPYNHPKRRAKLDVQPPSCTHRHRIWGNPEDTDRTPLLSKKEDSNKFCPCPCTIL